MKFGMMAYFDSSKPGDCQSFEILKIQHGAQPPSKKPLIHRIWAAIRPIYTKFGTTTHIDPLNPTFR